MDRPGVRQVPEASREHRKMEGTDREVMCVVPNDPRDSGIGEGEDDYLDAHVFSLYWSALLATG